MDMAGNRLQYLTTNDWILLRAKASRRTYKLGDEIIKQGEPNKGICIIRRGEASVELAGCSSRSILAALGPDDVCGEMAFLQQGKATAAVIASDEEVEVDEVEGHELRALLVAFPGLASRFYLSLAVILAQRLRETSKELAHEMELRDRCQKI
ncbi:MAG: cyclic nucleotide-binding domain-containing protein [Candidatus Sulfotelmatobacter sp.]